MYNSFSINDLFESIYLGLDLSKLKKGDSLNYFILNKTNLKGKYSYTKRKAIFKSKPIKLEKEIDKKYLIDFRDILISKKYPFKVYSDIPEGMFIIPNDFIILRGRTTSYLNDTLVKALEKSLTKIKKDELTIKDIKFLKLELLRVEDTKINELFSACMEYESNIAHLVSKLDDMSYIKDVLNNTECTLKEIDTIQKDINTQAKYINDSIDEIKTRILNIKSMTIDPDFIYTEDGIEGCSRIGFTKNGFEIYVNTDDSIKVPHFHVRIQSEGIIFYHFCLSIKDFDYVFHSDEDTIPLDSKIKEIVEFLKEKNKYTNMTNWELLIHTWNQQNNDNLEISNISNIISK